MVAAMAGRKRKAPKGDPKTPEATTNLDDSDFEGLDEQFSDEDPEDIEDAIQAIGDPDSESDEPEELPVETTRNGKTLYAREPLVVAKGDRRFDIKIGQPIPAGMIPIRRLRELGRAGAISTKPPPEPKATTAEVRLQPTG